MNRNMVATFHVVPSKEWFEEMVKLLTSMFDCIDIHTFHDLVLQQSGRKGTCLITFDDGDLSFYTHALPVLEKYNVPAALFLSSKVIELEKNFWHSELAQFDREGLLKIMRKHLRGGQQLDSFSLTTILKCIRIDDIWSIIEDYKQELSPAPVPFGYINKAMLQEILNTGKVTIGAHTMDHPILANENEQRSRFEIEESVMKLQNLTGTAIKYFAYPNGIPDVDFTVREENFLADAGVKLAFSQLPGFCDFATLHPYRIPRIGITRGNASFNQRKIKYNDAWNFIKGIRGEKEIQHRKKIYKVLGTPLVNEITN